MNEIRKEMQEASQDKDDHINVCTFCVGRLRLELAVANVRFEVAEGVKDNFVNFVKIFGEDFGLCCVCRCITVLSQCPKTF